MYKYLFLLLAFSCVNENKEFNWLSGDWQRVNDTAGQKTFENWQSEADGSLSGIGYTLEGIDTVFVEQLAIRKIEEKWQLIVTGVHEEPTYFEVTSFNGNQFVCENPKLDFPKKIQYSLQNDTLRAEVSNEEMSIDFVFIKK